MKRRAALLAVWTLPSALFLGVTALGYARGRIPDPARLDAASRADLVAPLRAAIAGGRQPCGVAGELAPGGAVVATVWLDGRVVVRADGRGATLAAATDQAAAQLRDLAPVRPLAPADLARARIQVDVVRGRAPLAGAGGWFDALAIPGVIAALGVNPGVDGIGGTVGEREVLQLPHELVAGKLLTARQPTAALPELALGADLARIRDRLRAGVPHAPPGPPTALFRFRTDAFVEAPLAARPAPPLPLERGAPPAPEPTATTLRAAGLAGARYLVDHLAPSGQYVYEHDLATGRQTDLADPRSAYSMARHAGVTYFLAEADRLTREPWLREPITRALAYLAAGVAASGCGGTAFACVRDRDERVAQLGTSALAVIALVEYQRATGDTRYALLAQQLGAFLLWMQRADGSFRHLYDPAAGAADERAQVLYSSGEAALALARLWAVTGEARYGDAAVRGLDWLVGWYDRFFLGAFVYGEEHWTCIAADAVAAYPPAPAAGYARFCAGYAAFLRAQQVPAGEPLAGAYRVTPFVVPFNTPAGAFTEALISTYALQARAGGADPGVRAQIRAALGYLLGQQLRPDSDFSALGAVDGGMPGSPVDRNVRIDFVQHTSSAMIRAAEWIDSPPP